MTITDDEIKAARALCEETFCFARSEEAVFLDTMADALDALESARRDLAEAVDLLDKLRAALAKVTDERDEARAEVRRRDEERRRAGAGRNIGAAVEDHPSPDDLCPGVGSFAASEPDGYVNLRGVCVRPVVARAVAAEILRAVSDAELRRKAGDLP